MRRYLHGELYRKNIALVCGTNKMVNQKISAPEEYISNHHSAMYLAMIRRPTNTKPYGAKPISGMVRNASNTDWILDTAAFSDWYITTAMRTDFGEVLGKPIAEKIIHAPIFTQVAYDRDEANPPNHYIALEIANLGTSTAKGCKLRVGPVQDILLPEIPLLTTMTICSKELEDATYPTNDYWYPLSCDQYFDLHRDPNGADMPVIGNADISMFELSAPDGSGIDRFEFNPGDTVPPKKRHCHAYVTTDTAIDNAWETYEKYGNWISAFGKYDCDHEKN